MSDERRARLKADVDEAYKLQMRAGIEILMPSVTMFGLVVTADTVLLQHEAKRRAEAGASRKEARIELGRRGIIPTETALREWQEEKERKMAAARESA
ncbi:hypothetical protein HWV62_32686 [Athelia sp. TMB]|nr:hypothetical protein HWV62_15833 [Athelia sp. TMB]KAF7981614.1 hypothetical protein HWV62_32686 [Athelia sp. TMB]